MKSCKTIEIIQNLTPLIRFQPFEDYLFDRILYIRNVLDKPDDYTDVPDHNSLVCELWRLLGDYQIIIGKKIKEEDKVED